MEISQFLFVLLCIFLAAKVFGELAIRLGQPSVLGELLAGVLIGPSLLGLISPTEFILLLAELGVFILLFEIGVESDLDELLEVGPRALLIAAVGVVVPFIGGFIYAKLLGLSGLVPIFVGATLTATSIGITAKVLQDLGKLSSAEGHLIIGAAVVDDVIGIIVLGVINKMGRVGDISLTDTMTIVVLGIGIIALAVLVGLKFAPYLMELIEAMKVRGALVIVSLIFALALGLLCKEAGTSVIIGAFAAGLVVPSAKKEALFHELKPIADFFVPIFFVTIGASIELHLFNPLMPESRTTLLIALGLVVIAFLGKLVCGYVPVGQPVNRLAIGVGMVPRGEVGLIFAEVGRRSEIISNEVFAILVITVALTTFIAPLLLRMVFADPAVAKPESVRERQGGPP